MAIELKLSRTAKETSPRRLPVKRSINFASVNEKKVNMKAAVPLIVVILILAGAFGQFAVWGRFAKLSEAESRVASVQAEIDDMYDQIKAMEDIPDKYAHYTWSGATEEELTRVDRVAVMELLDRVVYPRAEVSAWTLSGNCLTVPATADTLDDISEIARLLEEDPLVDSSSVLTASTSEYDTQEHDGVTAVITVYLSSAEEGETE